MIRPLSMCPWMERLSKGNVKKWVFGNLLSQGKMALMSGSRANELRSVLVLSHNLETSYRGAALVAAISSGILGQSPTVAMFKQSVNGTTSYEYRLVLEEDGVRELKEESQEDSSSKEMNELCCSLEEYLY